jgi:hypothetical protein
VKCETPFWRRKNREGIVEGAVAVGEVGDAVHVDGGELTLRGGAQVVKFADEAGGHLGEGDGGGAGDVVPAVNSRIWFSAQFVFNSRNQSARHVATRASLSRSSRRNRS